MNSPSHPTTHLTKGVSWICILFILEIPKNKATIITIRDGAIKVSALGSPAENLHRLMMISTHAPPPWLIFHIYHMGFPNPLSPSSDWYQISPYSIIALLKVRRHGDFQVFWSKLPQIRTKYLGHTWNIYRTLRGRNQVNFRRENKPQSEF